jgi:C4-dicarboxylate-specific signal transduction histidine kinase
MPTTSELVLAAIAVLAILAFALLLAPTFVWLRRRLERRTDQDKEARTNGSLDPNAIEREAAARAVVPAERPAVPAERAWKNSPSKSIFPSRRSVRMIVKASSNREMR